MKFTIYMDRWLRGEGEEASYLERPRDGKRCCVGQYCVARGLPIIHHVADRALEAVLVETGSQDPIDTAMVERRPELEGSYGSIVDDTLRPSITGLLYVCNDTRGVSDEDRIPWIKAGFEAAGHEVEFSPGWGPADG